MSVIHDREALSNDPVLEEFTEDSFTSQHRPVWCKRSGEFVREGLVFGAGTISLPASTPISRHSESAHERLDSLLARAIDDSNSVYEYSILDRTDGAWKYIGAGGGMAKALGADLNQLLVTVKAPSEVYRDFKAAGYYDCGS